MSAVSIYTSQLIFYVYAYLREDGSPYYIGKGKGRRMFDKRHNVLVPQKHDIIVLERHLTDIGSIALERRYILWYRRLDIGTGILENKTNGGEGLSGHIQTDEHKSKRKLFKPGNKYGQLNKGIEFSNEHRKKLSIVNTGKVMSIESSEKKSKAMIGKPNVNKGKTLPDLWRENMSKSSKGKCKSKEHIQNMAKSYNSRPKVECPYCLKLGNDMPMKRWHFDNCKLKQK